MIWGLLCGHTLAASPPSHPDVLFIISDDMSDWIQLLDRANPIATPNLDRLARRGVLFSRAYAASPACNPSRTAMLTGRAPSTTGVYGNASDWRGAMPDAVTLPQAFMRAGYRVEGAGKVFHHHLAGAFHDAASFNEFLPMPWPPDAPMPGTKLNGLPDFGTANTDWGPWPGKEGDALDVRSVDWCIERLRRTNTAPLFLACGLFRPHMPFFVPQRWLDRYPTNQTVMPALVEHDLDDVPPAGRALQAAEAGKFWKGMMESEKLHPGSYREAVRCYQAAATFADGQIGRLLDALDAGPRGQSTIIVFCSDNGYQLGEKECWEKFTLWDKACHIPLIIVAPGVTPAGVKCARAVSLLDLYPTLVELCSLTTNAPVSTLEGRSLTPLLHAPDTKWEYPAVMTYLRGNHAVCTERWRYIRYANGDEELCDHANDPGEHKNLAGDPALAKVIAELRQWLPKDNAPGVPDMKQSIEPRKDIKGVSRSPASAAALKWRSGKNTISVDGLERTFLLDMPKDLKPGAALLMVFHGYSDSAKAIRKSAGFTPLVEQNGFVAVYPQGTHDADGCTFFNVGYDFHKSIKVDDVKFARELAARLVRDLDLDPRFVFASGMSNGGDMCYLLACQPEPFVRAIAPVAGTMMAVWTNGFLPRARIPVMETHGTRDDTTPWAGDMANRDGYGAYLGTEGVMDFWVKQLALEKSATTEHGNMNSKKKMPVRLHRWWTAKDATEVRLYEIEGGGHDWPANLGRNNRTTAAEIWEFFQSHVDKK